MSKDSRKTQKITAKERHKQRLIEYLADWSNPFPTAKQDLALIIKLKTNSLYFHFTPAELNEILFEGIELRKRHSAIPRAEVYASMRAAAKDGNVPAQKEFLDRTEGKVLDRLQVGIDETTLNTILSTLPPDQAEETKKVMLAISAKKTKR